MPPRGGQQAAHTIILVQYTNSYQTRSYLDFPTVDAAMDGMQLFCILNLFFGYLCSFSFIVCMSSFVFLYPTAIVKMYEHKLKELNPSVQNITYDISDLYTYIDNIHDICGLVLDRASNKYDPKDRSWIKNSVFQHLRSQAG